MSEFIQFLGAAGTLLFAISFWIWLIILVRNEMK